MTVFSFVAALLVAGSLLFILPTLLRKEGGANRHALRDEVNLTVLRDQLRELDADLAAGSITAEAYQSARLELERRVAEDVQPAAVGVASKLNRRWTAVGVALAIPVASISLYMLLGSPAGLNPASAVAPESQAHAITEEQIVSMVTSLAERLKTKPDDAEGWLMLARSYSAMGRFADAALAYGKLVKLQPGNAGLLADYADALAMSQNRSLQGEPEKLIAAALAADPKNLKALALSGSAAYERRDFLAAAGQWKKILQLVPPESEIAISTQNSIREAQGLAGQGDAAVAQVAVTSKAVAVAAPPVAAAQVSGTVDIDPALRAKVADTDTVFIFARAVEGPRFPLAVLRKQVKDLPTSFTLDDSMSMVPDAKLSGFAQVVVGARISKGGSATPSAGDLEGQTEPVRPGAKGLKIHINSQRK